MSRVVENGCPANHVPGYEPGANILLDPGYGIRMSECNYTKLIVDDCHTITTANMIFGIIRELTKLTEIEGHLQKIYVNDINL